MEAKTFCWYGWAKSPTVGEVTGLICGKSCKETGPHDVNEWTIVISVWTMLLLFFLKTNQRNFLWYFPFRIAWPQELRSLFLGGTCFELFCWSSKSKFQESEHEFFQRNMTPYQGCCWSNCRSSWSWTWRATTFARRGGHQKAGLFNYCFDLFCIYINI